MYRTMKVTVVIRALNEERLINRTLDSVPRTVDVICIIDDGSTDATADMVRTCHATDFRINLLHHATNRGAGAAIITGYRQAHLDGDDVFVVVSGDA